MLMMQDENHEKMFYTFDGENWAINKLSVPDKYQILKIVGKFIIAKYMDGFTFLIEMKEDEIGLRF